MSVIDSRGMNVEQLIREIAARFEIPKLHLANAVEKLEIRVGPCQLGAF